MFMIQICVHAKCITERITLQRIRPRVSCAGESASVDSTVLCGVVAVTHVLHSTSYV